MSNAMTFAVTWSPFLRGIIVVLIGFVVLCGSVYVLLLTNLGTRLGFIVALAALFGWIFLLTAVWWAYGIGLRGKDPSWTAKAVVVGSEALADNPTIGSSDLAGWRLLPEDDPEHGQAVAAADDILVNQAKVFAAGDYIATRAFDRGGDRRPVIGDIDFFAFWHNPRYAVVEVYPVVKVATEPGKAPPKAVADTSAEPYYVLMQRNLGNRRRPAAFICIGSGLLFLLACYSLHKRDKLAALNRGEAIEKRPKEPAEVGV